jgi:hypothetical protein
MFKPHAADAHRNGLAERARLAVERAEILLGEGRLLPAGIAAREEHGGAVRQYLEKARQPGNTVSMIELWHQALNYAPDKNLPVGTAWQSTGL